MNSMWTKETARPGNFSVSSRVGNVRNSIIKKKKKKTFKLFKPLAHTIPRCVDPDAESHVPCAGALEPRRGAGLWGRSQGQSREARGGFASISLYGLGRGPGLSPCSGMRAKESCRPGATIAENGEVEQNRHSIKPEKDEESVVRPRGTTHGPFSPKQRVRCSPPAPCARHLP